MQAVKPKFDIKAIQSSWQTLNSIAHLRPIQNEKEYDRMVALMNFLLDIVGDDEEHALTGLLDLTGDLVSRYDEHHFNIDRVEPKDVLRHLMDIRGLKQEQLAEIIHQSNLSAILAGKRKISATLAGKLGKFFHISAAVFVPK
jgi:HTH-type transcriptional regulator/antitoxin HigA